MAQLSPQAKGALIATAGVLAATPDGVLIRWATHLGAAPPQVIFWKVLFNGLWGAVMLIPVERYKGRTFGELVAASRVGWTYIVGVTLLQAIIVVLFPTAFILTLAANVMLCVSLSPLIAAILGAVILKENPPPRTRWAIGAALAAVAIMFVPKLLGPSSDGDKEGGGAGDACALVVALVTASYLVLARAAGLEDAVVPIEVGSVAGAIFAALVLGVVIQANGSVFDSTCPLFFLAMVLNGFGLACIYLAFSIAPTFISGAQVGLISLIETVIGPLWVFAIYGETPPAATLIGGAILIVAVAAHEIVAMREDSLPAPAKAERADLRVADQMTYTPLEVAPDLG